MKFRVREIRRAKGIPQKRIILATGICRHTLTNIEHNRAKDPRISTLCGIARVLGVPVSDLIVEEGNAV